MEELLRIEDDEVSGEVAVLVPPGTLARARDDALASALAEPLARAAAELGTILMAAPIAYARQLPGKDAEGRTRYSVRARKEGDRLVPALKGK